MSIDLGFGGKKQKQSASEQSAPYFWNTGYSKWNATTRKMTLDPSIRQLQDEGINRARGMMGDLGGTFSDYQSKMLGTRGRLMGNQSALTQARVNPILEQSALRRGELQRSHGLRGISGSSFANQDMDRLAFQSGRAEGDARALAEADNIAAITGIDKDIVNSVMQKVQLEAQLNGYTTDIANQRLQQELAVFGLGKEGNSTGSGSSQEWGIKGKFDVGKAMTGGMA